MRNFFQMIDTNVSPVERGISLLGGAFCLYDALGKKKKNYLEAVLSAYLLYRGISGNCAFYTALGKTKPNNSSRNVNVRRSLRIDKPVEEVYDFWRNLENLPLFMEHLSRVEQLENGESFWEMKLPGDFGHITWKSEIVKERPYDFLGWRSLAGSSIQNAGKIEFHPLPEGRTELSVVITYHAPGGLAGEGAARMFHPLLRSIVAQDIENFRSYIEDDFSPKTTG